MTRKRRGYIAEADYTHISNAARLSVAMDALRGVLSSDAIPAEALTAIRRQLYDFFSASHQQIDGRVRGEKC
jgi:hypothetical protein